MDTEVDSADIVFICVITREYQEGSSNMAHLIQELTHHQFVLKDMMNDKQRYPRQGIMLIEYQVMIQAWMMRRRLYNPLEEIVCQDTSKSSTRDITMLEIL